MRTLGDLRIQLAARLGFGNVVGPNTAILDSFLVTAQESLYWAQDWKQLTVYEEATLAAATTTFPYPVDADGKPVFHPQRIFKISAFDISQWYDLVDGIDTAHYSHQNYPGPPLRYEFYADHIEVWPEADREYELRLWGVKPLPRFTESSDVPVLDHTMIFTFALATAKAHYRQPDKDIYIDQMNTLLATIRGKSFGNKVFPRKGKALPYPKPLVEGRDV